MVSPPYRLNKGQCLTVTPFPYPHWRPAFGDLVLPALNLSILDAGILIMVQQVRLMMFSLNMVDYPMTFLLLSTWDFFWWTSRGDHSKMFLLFEFCCGTPPSCLKVRGWVVGGWVAYCILVSAPGPFGL